MIILICYLLLLSNGIYSSSLNDKQLKRQARHLSTTNKCVCGIENMNTKLQRIIAGTEIRPELRFPWIVPLVYRNGSFFCAGSIINSRYILTSAHCFKYSKADAFNKQELRYMISSDAVIVPERITSNMLVGIGVHNLANDDQQSLGNLAIAEKIQPNWLNIDYAIIHRFYENIATAIRHDIALIRLRQELDFERFKWLRPICLPDEDQFELESFNKFQLEQYVQPNLFEFNNSSSLSNQLNAVNTNLANNDAMNLVNYQLNSHIGKTINQINNPLNSQLSNAIPFNNETSIYSNLNDDLKSSFSILNNDTLKPIERINSKRLKLDNLIDETNVNSNLNDNKRNNKKKRDINREDHNEKQDKEQTFFTAGWGSTEANLKLSKVPLWMELKMLRREECIERNGERVKWNFLCAVGVNKEQETSVGDSGGPLFGQIKRRNQNKNYIRNKNPSIIINNKLSTNDSTTTKATNLSIVSSTTEKPIIKYLTKPPLQFKFVKRPQKQQVSNEMNTLLTKVKENTNRHFYSAMIYEDLFKTHNLPHDDLSKSTKKEEEEDDEEIDKNSKLEIKESNDNDDMDEDNDDSSTLIKNNLRPQTSQITKDINLNELDLSKNNYVQLGITSWSSYLNPEISMYTDLRAYMSWIKRNTQDAYYCINDPNKLSDDKVTLPPEQNLPDKNLNLNCGAEKLNNILYPFLVNLFFDDKFFGTCTYFYSNFIICSDIYAEQTFYDVNQVSNRFTVQFYYANLQRFKVKNIINKILPTAPAINKREYMILQLDDPDYLLPRDNTSNRKFNRAIIESQLNKNNPQSSCITTRDYPLNDESSNLITFNLYSPGAQLIKTNLKLTAYRKCKQLSPNFVTRRFLCAEIGSNEEINLSDQLYKRQTLILNNNRFNSNSHSTSTNTTSIPFTMKLKNFFRIQTNLFASHYSNFNTLKSFDSYKNDDNLLIDNKINSTFLNKKSRSLTDASNLKELLDGQPVFHKIDEIYTLIGFTTKAPFPSTLSFRHSNLILILDLKKFRFQLVTKLIKSLRTVGRA